VWTQALALERSRRLRASAGLVERSRRAVAK
jgi:hypothetical protein